MNAKEGALISEVKKALTNHAGLEGADIFVSAVNQDITLKGIVDTQSERDKALDVARGVDGVMSVSSKLRIMADEEGSLKV